jgi:hypothetical protein
MGSAEFVWYVSYGSNLNRARFLTYLQGGRIDGNERVYKGCSDTSPPVDDVALELPHSLYFAGWSDRVWGGTSAGFITLDAHGPAALARAYLIAPGQFVEVVRQENANRTDVDDFEVTLERARQRRHARMLPSGTYTELIYCGERDGHAMLSFTASEDRTDFAAPSAAYLHVIGRGLQECHGLTTAQAAGYLGDRPGVRGNYTRSELLHILETSEP